MSNKPKPTEKQVQQYLAEARDNAERRESLEAILKDADETLRQASDFLNRPTEIIQEAWAQQFESEDPTGAKRQAYRQDCGREPDSVFELLHWMALGRAPDPNPVAMPARPFVIKASKVPDVPPDLFDTKEKREAAKNAAMIGVPCQTATKLAEWIGVTRQALNDWIKDRGINLAKGKSKKVTRIEEKLRPFARS